MSLTNTNTKAVIQETLTAAYAVANEEPRGALTSILWVAETLNATLPDELKEEVPTLDEMLEAM